MAGPFVSLATHSVCNPRMARGGYRLRQIESWAPLKAEE